MSLIINTLFEDSSSDILQNDDNCKSPKSPPGGYVEPFYHFFVSDNNYHDI